jgi:MscS family membrane protein
MGPHPCDPWRTRPLLNLRWLAFIALFLRLWPGGVATAQIAAPAPAATSPARTQDPLNRETPQSSVISFLEACKVHDYTRASKYFDLRDVPPARRLKEGPELAQQLALILDRDVQFDVASLSRTPEGGLADGLSPGLERVDSFEVDGQKLDLQLQRVTRRSGSQVWLFSSQSLRLIPQIVRLTSDSPLERHLPAPLVNWMWMNMALWR